MIKAKNGHGLFTQKVTRFFGKNDNTLPEQGVEVLLQIEPSAEDPLGDEEIDNA